MTKTPAQAKKRIKEIFRGTQTVSGVIALAKPRRIKASHRRRRRVASDHLLYILNNPLAATDPTGYLIGCGPNYAGCGGGGPFGERFGGGSSCRGSFCDVALGGGSNGAKKGDRATPEKRGESNTNGGLSGKLSDIGSAVKNGLFGPIIEYGERGQPGSLGDHARNGAKWAGNAIIDTADALFQFEAQRTPGGAASFVGPVVSAMPRFEYSDKGLKTPAVLQGTSLVVGGLKSAAGIAGKMRGAGQAAEDVAEAGAPGMRQAGVGRGAPEGAEGVGPALPGKYWMDRRAPAQVTPGVRTINDPAKPSSAGGTYHITTHYDEFGRQVGQTHRTSHGSPTEHPNPHHHRRDPTNGEKLKNSNGSRVWPGLFGHGQ